MRSYDPNDEYDVLEAQKIRAQPWMLEALSRNPGYNGWGPGEECMSTKGDSWGSSFDVESWSKFDIKLDDLNEVVNFHFTVSREAKDCEACGNSGYAPLARQVSDDFYDFANTGRKWNGDITLDEAQDLVDKGRLRNWDSGTRTWVSTGKVTPEFLERVNRTNDPERFRPKTPALFLQAPPGHSHLLVVNPEALSYPWGPATIQWDSKQVQEDRCNLSHDAINRVYLIRKRCERAGATSEEFRLAYARMFWGDFTYLCRYVETGVGGPEAFAKALAEFSTSKVRLDPVIETPDFRLTPPIEGRDILVV